MSLPTAADEFSTEREIGYETTRHLVAEQKEFQSRKHKNTRWFNGMIQTKMTAKLEIFKY